MPRTLSPEHKAKLQAARAAAAEKRRADKLVETIERESAPPAPKPKAKAEPVDLHTYSTDGDLVDIWERRMLHPNQKPSAPIRVHTKGMHLRWINLSNTGRYQRARYEEGWVPVQKAELVDEKEIYGVSFTVEGYVCRGEKQGEMLMKIPEAIWKKIRSRKYAEVEKSNKRIKESMVSAGAKHFSDKYNNSVGHEMADQFNARPGQTGAFRGEISFGTENVSPENEEPVSVTTE